MLNKPDDHDQELLTNSERIRVLKDKLSIDLASKGALRPMPFKEHWWVFANIYGLLMWLWTFLPLWPDRIFIHPNAMGWMCAIEAMKMRSDAMARHIISMPAPSTMWWPRMLYTSVLMGYYARTMVRIAEYHKIYRDWGDDMLASGRWDIPKPD